MIQTGGWKIVFAIQHAVGPKAAGPNIGMKVWMIVSTIGPTV